MKKTKKQQFPLPLNMRLDKLTWALRLYKTRAIATKACTAEKVKLNNAFSKPAKTVTIGDTISIKTLPVWRSFKIIDLPKSRVGAKLVAQYTTETTSEDDSNKITEYQLINNQNQALGIKGRPTKKDRRTLDKWKH